MEPTAAQTEKFEDEPAGVLPVIREHIVRTPGTCGGKPRIAGSRIQVKYVAVMHLRQGMSPEQIVAEYPHLTLSGVHAALAYYYDHQDEIDADLRAEHERYEDLRAKNPSKLRDRLEAMRNDEPDDSVSPR